MAKDLTVEQRLRKIYSLQLVDSRIDELKALRGSLPFEVEKLDNEIKTLNVRYERMETELNNSEEQVKSFLATIEQAKTQIAVYSEQQKNVRNNREYDALSKEIEYQQLETEHAQKLIGGLKTSIENKKEALTTLKEEIDSLVEMHGVKSNELEALVAETEREEAALQTEVEKIAKEIDEQLLTAYRKIRSRVKNGLAVVSIERGASEGSYFTIPPQQQIEIAARRRIILDENSGRIFVDPALAEEERENVQRIFDKIASGK